MGGFEQESDNFSGTSSWFRPRHRFAEKVMFLGSWRLFQRNTKLRQTAVIIPVRLER